MSKFFTYTKAIPLVYFTSLCILTETKALAQSSRKITYKSNDFELFSPAADTVYIEDPVTGEREMKISRIDPFPIKMNGIPIASGKEIQSPALPERSMDEYFIDLVHQHKAVFNKLADGQYTIKPDHFVIDEKGQIVYYKFEGIEKRNEPKQSRVFLAKESGDSMEIYKITNDIKVPLNPSYIDPELVKELPIRAEIDHIINDYINSGKIHFEAAEKDGKKILSLATGAHVRITVKNHQTTVDL